MFALYNSFLGGMLLESSIIAYILQTSILFMVQFSVLYSTFKFEDMSEHTITALTISIIYTLILGPAFVWISDNIKQETFNEAKINYQQKDQFRRMFDAL